MIGCPECSLLRARIKHLEEQLGWRASAERIRKIRVNLRVMPATARLILALYDSNGEVVSPDRLTQMARLSTKDTARVHVSHARKALGTHVIQTFPRDGWRMTEEGLKTISDAFARTLDESYRGWGAFSLADIRAIRKDPRIHKDIASDWGCSIEHVGRIKRREVYKWATDDD